MDDEQAREYYIKIKTLREQVNKLSEQLGGLDERTRTIQEMIAAINEYSEIQEGDELLVTLTNGVFIPATAQKTDHLLLNVGAGSVVAKSADETKELLSKQLDELAQMRREVQNKRATAAKQAADIEEEVTKQLQDHV